MAFTGPPEEAEWLPPEQAEALLDAEPAGNLPPEVQRETLRKILGGISAIEPALHQAARNRAKELLAAHTRVRSAARLRGVSHKVEPQLPPDLLGVYVFLPVPSGGSAA